MVSVRADAPATGDVADGAIVTVMGEGSAVRSTPSLPYGLAHPTSTTASSATAKRLTSEHGAARRTASGAFGRARATRAATEHAGRVAARESPGLVIEGGVPAPACAQVLAPRAATQEHAEDRDRSEEEERPEEILHHRSPPDARMERATARRNSTSSEIATTSRAYGRTRSAIWRATRARSAGARRASRATNSRTRRCASPGIARVSTIAPSASGVTVRSEK